MWDTPRLSHATVSRWGEGSDCCVCLCTKEQFRVSGLLAVLGGHPGKGSIRDSIVLLGDFTRTWAMMEKPGEG